MHMPKWSKILVSIFLILTVMTVSYLGHVDRIFGVSLTIRAEASSYTEKATSMLQFYKEGSELNRKLISGDELYAFGVFVSNFLMPFQSAMGDIQDTAFTTKMAQTFFGDAYTAQQFSDMKYTLGLVKSAQSSRRKLLVSSSSGHSTGGGVSVSALYMNFKGFFSEFFVPEGEGNTRPVTVPLYFTYSGASNEQTDIVWATGVDVFDVVLGQLISIAPTQAGVYFGTSGNLNSDLFVDCFGNISDGSGILIIPACMNPYAFYNTYLDEHRQPMEKAASGKDSKCPLQLPINNAFWMGTMVTPGSLTSRYHTQGSFTTTVKSTDESGTETSTEQTLTYDTTTLKEGMITLANLWYPLDTWTNSATATVGLDTMLGSYLAVFFSSAINTAFQEGWAVATNNQDVKYNDLMEKYLNSGKDGFFDAWKFAGGTTIPISAVLDDIALFDTYNNFSESAADSITVLSMYRDTESNTWWAADSTHGTHVSSIANMCMEAASDYISSSSNEVLFTVGELYTRNTPATGIDARVGSSGDTSKLVGYYNMTNLNKLYNNLLSSTWIAEAESLNLSGDMLGLTRSKLLVDAYQNEDSVIGYSKLADDAAVSISILDEVVGKIPFDTFALTGLGMDTDAGALKTDSKREIAKSAIVAAITGDPVWMTFLGKVQDGGEGDSWKEETCAPLMKYIHFLTFDGEVITAESDIVKYMEELIQPAVVKDPEGTKNGLLTGRPMDYEKARVEAAEYWAKDATIINHVFCQLAHPGLSSYTRYSNEARKWTVAILGFLFGIVIIAALVVVLFFTAPAWLIAAGVAAVAGAVILVAACINNDNTNAEVKKNLAIYYTSVGAGTGAKAHAAKNIGQYINNLSGAPDGTTNSEDFTSQTSLYKCYGLDYSEDAKTGGKNGAAKLPVGSGESPQGNYAAAANAFQLCFSLYSPYGSLGASLGAVSNVYTANGIVKGDQISTKVGSYITNDVNLWGGIYYAYMVDIFGLSKKEDADGKTMRAAQLNTNLPDVPKNLTNTTNVDLTDLLSGGEEQKDDAYYEQKQKDMLDRMDELTNPNATNFISEWITNTLNSWLIGAHKGITQASESDTFASVGGGVRYNGYSSYLSTATLNEMPFTSWVMENYSVIYATLMILIVIFGVLLIVSGQRTIGKTILSVLALGVILFVPRVAVDGSVAISNNIAQSVYNDRFNFWAYVQHQQYMSKLEDAEENNDRIEFLIVTNMQQAKDYYDSENGVTLKWMSPKKHSYWDEISKLNIEGNTSLNLSIFKWMMQGQFRQEIYSTDPLATYLYRPYNDISMEARTNLEKLNSAGTPAGPSGTDYLGTGLGQLTDSNRSNIAYLTSLITPSTEDADIKPVLTSPSSNNAGVMTATSGITRRYLGALVSAQAGSSGEQGIYAASTKSYADLYTASAEDYALTYPLTSKGGTQVGLESPDIPSPALQTYFLYTESPYYYFYNMFSAMADAYSDGSPKKLLLNKNVFRYYGDARKNNTSKADVQDDTLLDFLDLEDLFTYVIPGMQINNYYVDEWTELWGREITTSNKDDESFKSDLKNIWNMYSPWVDAMYECQYKESQIRSVGNIIQIDDAINPGSYVKYRNMVFSPADMQRNYVKESDLSEVEKKIMKVLEETYTDLMYLNNYQGFDDDVVLSAMAMCATFNFNEQFSQANLLNEPITLYPVGFEVRNFSYDAYMRMALLNTTGDSIFSEEDIYTTVITNTSFFTGLMLIINDLVAVYALPVCKLVCMIALFFLGVLIVAGGFLNSPKDIIKFITKQFLVPLIWFLVTLLGITFTSSMFVGEGLTTYVGSRGSSIAIGDPTLTIILMLICNLIAVFAFYRIIKQLISSYVEVFKWIKSTAKGTVDAAITSVKTGFVSGRGTVLAAAGAAAASTAAMNAGLGSSGGSSHGGASYGGNARFANSAERRESAMQNAKFRSNTKTRAGKHRSDSSGGFDADSYGLKKKTLGDKASLMNADGTAKHTLETYADGSSLVGKTTRAERKEAKGANKELLRSKRKAASATAKAERQTLAQSNKDALRASKKQKREELKKLKATSSGAALKKKIMQQNISAEKQRQAGTNMSLIARRRGMAAAKRNAKEQIARIKPGSTAADRQKYAAKVAEIKNNAKKRKVDARLDFAEKSKKIVEKRNSSNASALTEFRRNADNIRASKHARIVSNDSKSLAGSVGAGTGLAGAARRKARAISDGVRGIGRKVSANASYIGHSDVRDIASTVGHAAKGVKNSITGNSSLPAPEAADYSALNKQTSKAVHKWNRQNNESYRVNDDAQKEAERDRQQQERRQHQARLEYEEEQRRVKKQQGIAEAERLAELERRKAAANEEKEAQHRAERLAQMQRKREKERRREEASQEFERQMELNKNTAELTSWLKAHEEPDTSSEFTAIPSNAIAFKDVQARMSRRRNIIND